MVRREEASRANWVESAAGGRTGPVLIDSGYD